MLFICVVYIVRGYTVSHGKVLEYAADVQTRQGIQCLQLADGLLKPGAHRKADAAHAGVDFQMHLDLHTGLHGGGREGAGVFCGKTGGGQLIVGQHRRIGRVGIAQNQNRLCDAAAAQMTAFAQRADREGCRALLLQHAGYNGVTVAVGVRLDNGADRPADGAADIIKVFTQGSQVNLSPTVLFKCKIIHSAPFPP